MSGRIELLLTSQKFAGKYQAAAIGAGIIVNFLYTPAKREVEANGAFVAERRNRLDARAARLVAGVAEMPIEQAPYALAPVVGVDADEMHIAGGSAFLGRDKTEQETDEGIAVVHDERFFTEFVEEDGMGEGTDRAAPPMVDHFDNLVEVGLGHSPCLHRRAPSRLSR